MKNINNHKCHQEKIVELCLLLLRCHNVKNGKEASEGTEWKWPQTTSTEWPQDTLAVQATSQFLGSPRTSYSLRYCLDDVTTLKMTKKPVKLLKENPAKWAGLGKQNKGK